MNLQTCHCGWSKVTTHQGLRTHQGKKGCTPKGMRIPESDQFRLNSYVPTLTYVGPPIRVQEPLEDFLTSFIKPADQTTVFRRIFDESPKKDTRPAVSTPVKNEKITPSDTSLQVCHCGWSEVTTYQGLRTHQGMKGCTLKGMRIPESEQFRLNSYRPALPAPPPKVKEPSGDLFTTSMKSAGEPTAFRNIFDKSPKKDSRPAVSSPVNNEKITSSDTSLQTCHCGWSEVTTYQGLRTHQGMKGCTLKGMRIPESEQFRLNGYMPALPAPPTKVKEPSVDSFTTSMKSAGEPTTFRRIFDEPPKTDSRPAFSSPVNNEKITTSDTSLQVCHCGWSEVTTYQGLRTHQGMMGCTPKGMRIPESEQIGFNSYIPALSLAPPAKVKEPSVDLFTASMKSAGEPTVFRHIFDESPKKDSRPAFSPPVNNEKITTSDTSLQVCHCGWSEVTTYQGLRTHQGMMGCTPKGMRIPESEQIGFNSYIPALSLAPPAKVKEPSVDLFTASMKSAGEPTVFRRTFDESPKKDSRPAFSSLVNNEKITTSDTSLQTCHCGWSEVTTYQGLRTHQGMMGCTPKGMRIPESEQFRLNSYAPTFTYMAPPIRATGPSLDLFSPLMKSEEPTQKDSGPFFSTPVKNEPFMMFQSMNLFDSPVNTAPSYTDLSLFQTPQHAYQATNARRALDFSAGAQQVLPSIWELPTTMTQEAAVQQREEEREKQREKEREREREAQKLLKAKQDKIRAELREKLQIREQKMDEIRSSEKACKGSLDAEIQEINSVFAEVMRAVEDTHQKALQPLEERKYKLQREAQALVQKLQKEVDNLRLTIDEFDKNPDLQGFHLKGLDESRDWKNITVDTSPSLGTLRTKTSDMMEQIQQKLEKLSPVELRRIPTFAVDVRFDPATAHKCLLLSPDGKIVRDGGKDQNIPDGPERFDMFGSVLGLNRLTSGKSYWEVEVSNKTGWDLGVAKRNAKRKGKLTLSPDNGYWVTVHYENKSYAALTAPPVSLSLTAKPQTVGVFVDYEEGLVSFYDVTAQSHIYSFTKCSFSDEILPYFSPHLKQNGKNSHPLIISAMKKQ